MIPSDLFLVILFQRLHSKTRWTVYPTCHNFGSLFVEKKDVHAVPFMTLSDSAFFFFLLGGWWCFFASVIMPFNYALILFFDNNHMIARIEWAKCGAFIRWAGEAADIKETSASLLRGRRHPGAVTDGYMWCDFRADVHIAPAKRYWSTPTCSCNLQSLMVKGERRSKGVKS